MKSNLKYVWKATYKDRTEFNQFNEDGTENLFGDIEQDELDEFSFNSSLGHTIKLKLKDDMRLICFRRHSMNFMGQNDKIQYVLGYQKTLDGKNVKTMMFIDDEGNVLLSDGVQ